MGERKVLNKYYPPDFDPAKIPRRRQPKNLQIKVRMMLPMSIRCNTCGNYIYKGTKFNSRKEDCIGETYLGIQVFRFYFKCSRCSAELTMKTDPQNSDYMMESGATRNFEPWRAADEAIDAAKSKREAEEMGDAMKALENRTLDSKQEMDIMAALDEMKSMRARHANVGTNEMLEALSRTRVEKEKDLEEEDEAVLRAVVFQNSTSYVHRLDDDDEEEEEDDDEDFQERKRLKSSDFRRSDFGVGVAKEPLAAAHRQVKFVIKAKGEGKANGGQEVKAGDSKANANGSKANANGSKANANGSMANGNGSMANANGSKAKAGDSEANANGSGAKADDSKAEMGDGEAKLDDSEAKTAESELPSLALSALATYDDSDSDS